MVFNLVIHFILVNLSEMRTSHRRKYLSASFVVIKPISCSSVWAEIIFIRPLNFRATPRGQDRLTGLRLPVRNYMSEN